MSKIRVLLCDDHPLVRAGFAATVRAELDLELVGEAANGDDVVRKAAALDADVIVMDLYMPGMDGLEATRRIMQSNPSARVLAITAGNDVTAKDAALAAGASGFVRKPAPVEEILRAIRVVARGETFVESTALDAAAQSKGPGSAPALSEREEQVLRHFAEGLVMKDIAAQTNLSTRTLETYKARGMEKLGITSRAELVQYALKHGWLKPDFPL